MSTYIGGSVGAYPYSAGFGSIDDLFGTAPTPPPSPGYGVLLPDENYDSGSDLSLLDQILQGAKDAANKAIDFVKSVGEQAAPAAGQLLAKKAVSELGQRLELPVTTTPTVDIQDRAGTGADAPLPTGSGGKGTELIGNFFRSFTQAGVAGAGGIGTNLLLIGAAIGGAIYLARR